MNVYMLIDRSGSMASLWAEAIGSVNAYANKVSEARKYVAVFDSVSYDVLRDLTADSWKDIGENEASPRGMTPLYDAAGRLLDKVFSDKPEKAVIVIMTDGAENNSTEYTQATIKARLSDAEKMGWQVVFLGANFDSVSSESAKVGVRSNRSVNFTKGSMKDGMELLAEKSMLYASATDASTYAATMDFMPEEIDRLSGKVQHMAGKSPLDSSSFNQSTGNVVLPQDAQITPKKRTPRKKKGS